MNWGAAKMGAVVAATGMLGVARFSSRNQTIGSPVAARRAFLSPVDMLSAAASQADGGGAVPREELSGYRGLAVKAKSPEMFDKAVASSGRAEAPVRKIVRTASLAFEVSDQAKARALVRAAAFKHGGEIDSDQSAGDAENQSGVITIKAAPEQLDAILRDLEGVGRALERSVSSQNLSEEYVDLKARLENHRKVEKRLAELMAFKTHKLADVLQVEHELERVGQEIEQTIGRMKYIDGLAAQSRITVRLSQPHLIKEPQVPGVWAEIRNSVTGSARTFVSTGLALLSLTGFVLAIGLWTAPVTFLLWHLKRRIWG